MLFKFENPRLSSIFLHSFLSCWCRESTSPPALRFLTAFFWVKGQSQSFFLPLTEVVWGVWGRVCLWAWTPGRIYWHAEGLRLKEKTGMSGILQDPAQLSFQRPHTLFWSFITCLRFLCVCVLHGPWLSEFGRFVLDCTVKCTELVLQTGSIISTMIVVPAPAS